MCHYALFQVENLKEVQPTKFWGVPRVWEKIEDRMKEVSAQQSSPLKRAVAQWAKQTSLDYHQSKREGKSKNSFKFNIAKKLVLRYEGFKAIISSLRRIDPPEKCY